jgi:hypothetical protein
LARTLPSSSPSVPSPAGEPAADDAIILTLSEETVMAPPKPIGAKKYFSVEEANKALPLVKAIVADIVRQWHVVNELRGRLSALLRPDRKRLDDDPYGEELKQSQAEMEAEEEKLRGYHDELTKLGVELKGVDGLCDFPSLMDGREVLLCWRPGEPSVQFWHEVHAGFAGRQPLPARSGPRAAQHSL